MISTDPPAGRMNGRGTIDAPAEERGVQSFGTNLIAAFVAVVGAFIAATAYSEFRGRSVDDAAVGIATRSAPMIQHLATARSRLSQLRQAETEYVAGVEAGRPASTQMIRQGNAAVAVEIAEYGRIPSFRAAVPVWQQARQRLATMEAALDTVLAAGTQDRAAMRGADLRFRAAAEQVARALDDSIDVTAQQARGQALRIQEASGHRRHLSFGLAILCGLATLLAGVLLTRAVRGHEGLRRAYQSFLERRSAELESFAGRVAHDVRGSLTGVSLALQEVGRTGADARTKAAVDRGLHRLDVVLRVVDDLLAFARAGARADVGARAELHAVLEEVVASHHGEAAQAGVELVAEGAPSMLVACSPGALTSILSNLVGNAVKHMGSSAQRRVLVRATPCEGRVRVEVEDTGPGIPADMRSLIFEPYVRGPRDGSDGIGLGLATVKRLAEGHGGSVGVDASPQGGSVFWFELHAPLPT